VQVRLYFLNGEAGCSYLLQTDRENSVVSFGLVVLADGIKARGGI
jgi:hypothetical protein